MAHIIMIHENRKLVYLHDHMTCYDRSIEIDKNTII